MIRLIVATGNAWLGYLLASEYIAPLYAALAARLGAY
jgi:hypothetical protein